MFRCYNGAWDSAAMALFKEQDKVLSELRLVEPEAHCTYFPQEGTFQVHKWGRPLSGVHGSRLAALRDALSQHGGLLMTLAEKWNSVKRPEYSSADEMLELVLSVDDKAETQLIDGKVWLMFSDGSTARMGVVQ